MDNLVFIGEYAVPNPTTYEGTTKTLADIATNVNGQEIGAVIREDVGSVSMKWDYISREAWAELLSKFSSARGGNFVNEVQFFCQDTGDYETRLMRVSDRTAGAFSRDSSGNVKGYRGAAFSLIEL